MPGDYNKLTITADTAGTVVQGTNLDLAEGISFDTLYPGGLFGSCSFFVPRDVTRAWALKEGQRLKIRNGLQTVWEGRVTAIEIEVQQASQGNRVTCVGYWGDVLMARTWRKPWADTRIDDGVWIEGGRTTITSFDRQNRLRMTPDNTAWTAGWAVSLNYTAPTGQTIKRVTFNYDLQEGAQAWLLRMYNETSAGFEWSVSASGTGSANIALVTPASGIRMYLESDANQTPANDKAIYGQWSSVVVYTETSAINLTEISYDVQAKATELSTSTSYIGTNTYSLVPFVGEGTLADIITSAAAYGDASYNSWAVGVRESALSTDGKPVLFAEAYPALTDYDYAVRLDDKNVVAPFAAVRDISEVRNWIGVEYHDASGRTVYRTPDDDANLKDTTSITAYGERHEWLNIDTSSTTTATNYARRFLAARKNPQWRVTSDIVVVGYVRGKTGVVPASEIRAGKRVKIENYLSDLSGSGLTLLVTGTQYNDNGETCRLSVGQPDSLDVWLTRR